MEHKPGWKTCFACGNKFQLKEATIKMICPSCKADDKLRSYNKEGNHYKERRGEFEIIRHIEKGRK